MHLRNTGGIVATRFRASVSNASFAMILSYASSLPRAIKRLAQTAALVAATMGVAAVSPARAQDADQDTSGLSTRLVATPSDAATIETCLADSSDSPFACIGSVAVVCVKLTMPQGTRSEATCTERERTVWQTRLNATTAELHQSLPGTARKRFATLQRAWQNYYTLKCDFMNDDTPSERSQAMRKGCELREVATRSIEVDRYLRRQKRKQRS